MNAQPKLTTQRALLRLLTESPNEVVTRHEVCAELGHEVSRNAVSKAARRLALVMPIDGIMGRSGGYRYLVVVRGEDGHVCGTCARYGRYGVCKRLKRRVSITHSCGGHR